MVDIGWYSMLKMTKNLTADRHHFVWKNVFVILAFFAAMVFRGGEPGVFASAAPIADNGFQYVHNPLENYKVVRDVDVAPETIVETAIAEEIRVVGLSALMTTTVVSMEETIRQLREKKPGTKVVVGGAVMTQEYADRIGADCYAKDAMATVRFCDEVFGGGK